MPATRSRRSPVNELVTGANTGGGVCTRWGLYEMATSSGLTGRGEEGCTMYTGPLLWLVDPKRKK